MNKSRLRISEERKDFHTPNIIPKAMEHYAPFLEILLAVLHEMCISRYMRCAFHTVRDVHLVHHSLIPFTSFPQVFHRKGNSISIPIFLLRSLFYTVSVTPQTLSGTIRNAEDSRPADDLMVSILCDGVMIDYTGTGRGIRNNSRLSVLKAVAYRNVRIPA